MFELRAFSSRDQDGVLRALEARDRADYGDPVIRRAVPLGEWRDRRFDHADAIVAAQAEEIVGYGMLDTHGGFAFVAPDHEGLGIGSELLSWVEGRARASGRERTQQVVAAGNVDALALVQDAGYRRVRSLLLMELELARRTPAPNPPEGISLTPLDVDRDGRDLHAADAEAFAENAEALPTAWEVFYDREFTDPALAPQLSRLARRGAALVGYATCVRQTDFRGYVEILGVVEAERRRGLGRAILLSAFEAFSDAGLSHGRLMVASDNPRARALYEGAGMRPVHELVVLERTL